VLPLIQAEAREPWGQRNQMTPRNLPGRQTWYFDPTPRFFLESNNFWHIPRRCYWGYIESILHSESSVFFVSIYNRFVDSKCGPHNFDHSVKK